MSHLQLQNISHRYPKQSQLTLDHLDLEIRQGETLALLGPSGCGKTTLLRSIAGHESVQGSIQLDDQELDFHRHPPEKRNFAMVYQDGALFPHLSIEKNIAFGLSHLDSSERGRRVASMAEMTKIADKLKRYPYELSGGQRQRVAIARALATEPRLLLLDEPLSSLDAHLRLELGRDIRQLVRDRGLTTLLVTHDQSEAFSLADRIAVMNGGVIQQIGSPRDIYERPATPFVASFVGEGVFIEAKKDGNSHEAQSFVRKEWLQVDPEGVLVASILSSTETGPERETLLGFPNEQKLIWKTPASHEFSASETLRFSLIHEPVSWT